MEAIILAGGLGTRLRSAVPSLPKCMAPINGVPFIAYVISHLQKQGVEKFIFSLGYKSEAFIQFLTSYLPIHNYTIVVEDEPLGTGGAIKLGLTKSTSEHVIALNGDSLFKVNINQELAFHIKHNAKCTLALKPMQQFDRYGAVEIDKDNIIVGFKEKQYVKAGYINGGVYILEKNHFLSLPLDNKFSFEVDYLQKYCDEKFIYGDIQDTYFIDIGIPEDYDRAQNELTL